MSVAPFGSVGAVYSDNLDQATSHGPGGTALDAIGGLQVRRTGTISINADASALYREYLGGNLPGQLLPSINALATAVAIPERLLFTVQDTLGQISTQAFDALNDTSRQNSNFLTLGPQIMLPLGARNLLRTDLQYGVSTYQTTNISNTRYTGEVGLGRTITESSTLSLNYRYEQIDYKDSDIYPRVDNNVVYLRYSVGGSRTYLALEAGRDTVKVAQYDEERTAPHLLLTLRRRLTPLMTLTAEYNHGTSDASDTLRATSQNVFNTTGSAVDVQATAQPFTVDRGYIMLLRSGPFGTLAAQVTSERDRYTQDVDLNRTERTADVILDHRLTPLMTLAASIRWQRGRYDNTGVPDNHLLTTIGITRQIARSFQAALILEHNRGTSLEGVGVYTENRATLAFTYAVPGAANQLFDPVSQFRYSQRTDAQTNTQGLNPFSPDSGF